jgi:hypothetical protein
VDVWGPPGTGKSITMNFLADVLLNNRMTLLITAHINEAVDNLMEKLAGSFSGEAIVAGEIIRWRVTRSEKLQRITLSIHRKTSKTSLSPNYS